MRKLNLGVAGLGRAFSLMAPSFAADPRIALVAAADPRPEARQRFGGEFAGRAYATVEELCADPSVEAVYVATPHGLHAANARVAAAHGKHILVEKPMALTAEECRAMVQAARSAGVHIVVGHSHSFDAPIARTRSLIDSGSFGALRMISALNYTDFLYRPRRPEELDPAKGGGAVMNQAAHHVDILRVLCASPVVSVKASIGTWDPARPVEGAYAALLTFADGAFATLTYSGYAHFDSDELVGWIGEGGQRKQPRHGAAREGLAGNESDLKNARNYGGAGFTAPAKAHAHPHFGFLVASCEHADLRPTPEGVWVYADNDKHLEKLAPPTVPRAGVIDELYAAIVDGKPPLHDGAWGMATLAVCEALLRSARQRKEVSLSDPTA
jgi:phthalate 4,5-cis-dihydrodiol dehydrogenase